MKYLCLTTFLNGYNPTTATTARSTYKEGGAFLERETIMLFWDDRAAAVRHSHANLNQHLIDEQCQHEKSS